MIAHACFPCRYGYIPWGLSTRYCVLNFLIATSSLHFPWLTLAAIELSKLCPDATHLFLALINNYCPSSPLDTRRADSARLSTDMDADSTRSLREAMDQAERDLEDHARKQEYYARTRQSVRDEG
jgi:hypothetical protein